MHDLALMRAEVGQFEVACEDLVGERTMHVASLAMPTAVIRAEGTKQPGQELGEAWQRGKCGAGRRFDAASPRLLLDEAEHERKRQALGRRTLEGGLEKRRELHAAESCEEGLRELPRRFTR